MNRRVPVLVVVFCLISAFLGGGATAKAQVSNPRPTNYTYSTPFTPCGGFNVVQNTYGNPDMSPVYTSKSGSGPQSPYAVLSVSGSVNSPTKQGNQTAVQFVQFQKGASWLGGAVNFSVELINTSCGFYEVSWQTTTGSGGSTGAVPIGNCGAPNYCSYTLPPTADPSTVNVYICFEATYNSSYPGQAVIYDIWESPS
ncbi:MAG TPA: hypothetical protein VKV02_01265 [Acidobacteriaceae bacterium]|nr:hypothetical protein [Acidobacteriaceae bacterium]